MTLTDGGPAAAAPPTTPTPTPAAPTAWQLSAVVDDLRVLRRVLALRLSWPVRTYRRVATAASLAGALAAAGVVAVVAGAAGGLVRPGDRTGLATLGLVALVYAGLGTAAGPLLGARRRELAQDSNAGFYRALDLPQHVVVLTLAAREALPRTVVATGAAAGLAGATLLPGGRWPLAAAVCTVPVLWWVASCGLALHVAGRPVRPRPVGVAVPLAAVLALAAGWLAAPLGARLVAEGVAGATTGVQDLAARAAAPGAVAGLVALSAASAAGAAVLGLRARRRLAARSFLHVHAPAPRTGPRRAGRRPAAPGAGRALVRQWAAGRAGELAGRTYAAVAALTGVAVGLRLAGVDLTRLADLVPASAASAGLDPGALERLPAAVFAGTCAAVSLALASTAQARAGVRAHLGHLRQLWEGGAPATGLALRATGAAVLPSALAVPPLLLLALLTGARPLEAVVWPLATPAACLLADLLVAPPRQADGSVEDDDTLSALACVGLLVPFAVAAWLAAPAAVPVALTLLLLTGALLCLHRRLLRLPSTSPGWSPATTPASPSSTG